MQKKIKLTKAQETLFAKLKSLAKLTNQRILRLERAFKHEPIVVTQLKEKLSIEPLQAISERRTCKSFKKI